MTQHIDLAETFGQYVARVTFGDLPDAAVQAAKFSTLDGLGVSLAASGLMGVMPGVVELAREWGGRPESTVLGFGGKLPAIAAAFVNGAMGHGLDYDDHLPEGHHPTVAVLPALLALAERRGGVTGAEFVTALAVGQDLFARLRKNVTWKQDWFLTPVIGTVASAAACAKLLDLPADRVADAIGIACTQAATTMQTAYGTGGDLRGMYGGFAAKAAVLSALLADKGVRATSAPLEGSAGFLPVYFGQWDRDAMLAELGREFHGATILYKLWPSCGVTHAYIDTALRLMDGPGRAGEIAAIEVFGGDFARRLSEPPQLRRRPPTAVDAKFSIPYTVALALTTGTVGVGDFSDERRCDPAIHAVADKITFVDDPDCDWTGALPDGAVRIRLRDGSELHSAAHHDQTPGAARRPLDWPQLVDKFTDCVRHAVTPLDDVRIKSVVDTVGHLESLDDVEELTASLA
ncbi:MmgE/PrpD family protein [Mycolicibacterium litorale]|uniref:MmgE/PrpD family protein n=1 Tax=Mycolicibacterium litorale TaxID=758802 RepID=UPI003CF2CC14